MTMFRTGWRWKLPLIGLCLWLLAVIVTARPGEKALYPAQAEGVTIYVLNNGFHSDVVLPADRVMARGGLLAEAGKAGGGASGWSMAGEIRDSTRQRACRLRGRSTDFAPCSGRAIRP